MVCQTKFAAECYFFLKDNHARAYALMGDLVAEGKCTPMGNRLKLEGAIALEIFNRLFNCCWFFHLFCHNTGYDPKTYIEALLAEFDSPVTYDMVRKKCEEDVALGILIKYMPKKNGN